MTNYILDVETCGVANHPTLGHPQVIELAYIPVPDSIEGIKKMVSDFEFQNSLLDSISKLSAIGTGTRYKPSMTIHKRAREVHGIWNKDLLACPRSEDLVLPTMSFMVGHNISFDYRCLGKPEGVRLICTLALAKQIDKHLGLGFKNHKQDDLLLHFYGESIRPLVTGHHAALTDCVKTLLLLTKLLELVPTIVSLEELYTLQQASKGK